MVLQDFASNFPEIETASSALNSAQSLLKTFNSMSSKAPTFFTSAARMKNLQKQGEALEGLSVELKSLMENVKEHPFVLKLEAVHTKVVDACNVIKQAGSGDIKQLDTVDVSVIKDKLSTSLFTSLLGIQNMFKLCKSYNQEDQWLIQITKIVMAGPSFKAATLTNTIKNISQTLDLIPELMMDGTAGMLKEFVYLVDYHIISLESMMDTFQTVSREWAKLLSVLIKIFATLAIKGFCPIKGFEDLEKESSGMDFKDSEEEAGLGDGEGKKDVSDEIENEDMLDGAYDPEEKREEEQKDQKEEEKGIEMSDNFEGKMQDKEASFICIFKF